MCSNEKSVVPKEEDEDHDIPSFGCEVDNCTSDLCRDDLGFELQEPIQDYPMKRRTESTCSCTPQMYDINIGNAGNVQVGSLAPNASPYIPNTPRTRQPSECPTPTADTEDQVDPTDSEPEKSRGVNLQITFKEAIFITIASDADLERGQFVEEAIRRCISERIILKDVYMGGKSGNVKVNSNKSGDDVPNDANQQVTVNLGNDMQLSIRTQPSSLGKKNFFRNTIGERRWISPVRWVVTIASLLMTCLLIFLFIEGLKYQIQD